MRVYAITRNLCDNEDGLDSTGHEHLFTCVLFPSTEVGLPSHAHGYAVLCRDFVARALPGNSPNASFHEAPKLGHVILASKAPS